MAHRASTTLRSTLRITLLICLAALPFELASGFRLGPLLLANVELLLLVGLALWAALHHVERRLPSIPRWLLTGTAAVGVALVPSAELAVPVGDSAALGGAIRAALTNPARRNRLGGAAQCWAFAHYAAWTAHELTKIDETAGQPHPTLTLMRGHA